MEHLPSSGFVNFVYRFVIYVFTFKWNIVIEKSIEQQTN